MPTRLAGNSYVERGSPSTVIYIDGATAYVIDPGQGEDRPERLRKALRSLSATQVVVLLTHYHSDHVEAVEELSPSEVIASARDAPMVRDPELRVLSTFNYPLPPTDPALMFRARPARVTHELGDGDQRYGPIEVVRVPGHTEGQLAYSTPDGVIHVGDAMFGDKVLQKYGVPYHKYPCQSIESLERLSTTISRYEYVVPGHGPIVRGPEAGPLIDLNLSALKALVEQVEEALRSASDVREVVQRVARGHPGASWTPDNLMLLEASVKGVIGCLRAQGRLEEEVSDGVLRWRLRA